MNTEYEEDGGDVCENDMMRYCGYCETSFDTLEYHPLEEFIQNAVSAICAATFEALQKHDEKIREERGI